MNRDIYETIRDPEFAEHFLGRLVADCKYILGACMDYYDKGYFKPRKAALTHLWAQDDVDEQISLMRACKKTLDKAKIKSRISDEDIDNYEAKLKEIENLKESNSSLQSLKKKIRELYEEMKEYYFYDDGYFNTDDLKYFRHNLKSANKKELIEIVKDILEEVYEEIQNEEDEFGEADYEIINYKDNFEDILEDLLESVKKHSKLNESKSHLLEGYHHPFDRDIEEDVIKPYKYYYKSLDFKKDYKTKTYGYENYNIISVSYNGTSRTLKIEAVIGLKAYGDGYEKRCIYKGDRSKYDRNTFEFDEYLSQNIAKIISPIGLVKTGLYYPTKYFHYSDYHQDAPEKLHWVDHVILDVTKVYD